MRYIAIKEVPVPYIQIPTENGTEPMKIHTGALMLEMLVRPVAETQNGPQAAASDYQRQRAARNAIRALDTDKDGQCDVTLGDSIGLEDAWYELIMEQARIWPWSFRAPEIADLIEEWEGATDVRPLGVDTDG